ncbi:MAG: hypothetical protein LBG52_06820 [Candidatus Peribacteria bacterium]|nr:hypothetical protein [Candidatus Peribacteria bacterium]
MYFKTAASNELAKDLQLQSKKQGENYDGVVRDPSDLISSKQALRILYNDGVDETTLYQLNFGNLDVDAVIDEIAPKEESFRQETNTDLFQLRDEFFSEDWGQKTATEFTNTIRYY